MGSIVQCIMEESSRIWKLRDLRTDGWPLTHSPMTPVLMSLSYLFMVKIWGPKLMESRKPFQLRGVLIIYNAFQIVFNGWMFWESNRVTWFNGYSIICQPVDYSLNEDALRIIFIGYCLYISKLIDFLDTLFFILRKKDNQITFLHVFHHSFTPLSVWLCFRFIAGGQSCFFLTCNTLVHVVMYFYYMMAAMGPRFQKYLWWKKYLTVFQMVQFVLVGFHSIQLLFIDCDYPKAYSWGTAIQAVMYFFLFKNYHTGAYSKRPTEISGSSRIIVKKHL
nr:elongation of very long chain fatty acids protein 1 [Daphnia magna]